MVAVGRRRGKGEAGYSLSWGAFSWEGQRCCEMLAGESKELGLALHSLLISDQRGDDQPVVHVGRIRCHHGIPPLTVSTVSEALLLRAAIELGPYQRPNLMEMTHHLLGCLKGKARTLVPSPHFKGVHLGCLQKPGCHCPAPLFSVAASSFLLHFYTAPRVHRDTLRLLPALPSFCYILFVTLGVPFQPLF